MTAPLVSPRSESNLDGPKSPRPSRLGTRLGLLALVQACVTAGTAVLLLAFGCRPAVAVLLGFGAGLCVVQLQATFLFWPLERVVRALGDGVQSFHDRDFGLRIAVTRTDELGELVTLYNSLGSALRKQRQELFQRELLLDTILRNAPSAILLTAQNGRVVFANRAARDLLAQGANLEGQRLADAVSRAPAELARAFTSADNALVTLGPEASEETYRVLRRAFQIHTEPYQLLLAERLTTELRQQEVGVWKNAIRLLNHELNNSLAPIRSFVHSVRRVLRRPEDTHRLEGILDAIAERVTHLNQFLERYACFARLPEPQKQPVVWSDFLETLRALYSFQIQGALPPKPGYFDPAQLQQAVINLLKNAAESGSPPEAIAVSVTPSAEGGVLLRVLDQGQGMTQAVMKQALLPFFSAKAGGAGLGLSLCNEILQAHGGRLSLESRSPRGTVVTCYLPPRSEQPLSSLL